MVIFVELLEENDSYVEVEDEDIVANLRVAQVCAGVDTEKDGFSKHIDAKGSQHMTCKDSLKRGSWPYVSNMTIHAIFLTLTMKLEIHS